MRLLGFFLILFSLPLPAWDEGGHEIVAYIAYARLNPKAKAAVDTLAPQIIGPYGRPYNHYTIACWMDDLKGRSTKMADLGFFKPWHFIDLGLSPEDPLPDLEPGTDNEEQGNVVQALKRVDVVLRGGSDPYVTSPAMACALAIHLVGDIHQPLHAATQFYQSRGRLRNDHGGNGVHLLNPCPTESRLNLHFFWDSAWCASSQDEGTIIFDSRYNDRAPHGNPQLYLLAQSLTTEAPEAGTDFSFSAENWARESNDLAKRYAYADLLPGERRNEARLSQAYVQMARELARKRLVLAGYRLAELLNTTLGATQQQPPAPYPAGPSSTDTTPQGN